MNDNDENSREEKLTPNGETAVERCPICKRWNSPGAVDTCEHYFASEWDGDIIWNDTYSYRYEDAWSSLWSLIVEAYDEEDSNQEMRNLAMMIALGFHVPTDWLEQLDDDVSAKDFLLNHCKFDCGDEIVTDGMLSGEGHSLYHENPAEVEEFMDTIVKFSEAVAQVHQKSAASIHLPIP